MDWTQDMFLVSEVAKHFRVTNQTIRRWIKTEQLASVKVGKSILIPKDEVIRFTKERHGGN